jgi:hypothetical protein
MAVHMKRKRAAIPRKIIAAIMVFVQSTKEKAINAIVMTLMTILQIPDKQATRFFLIPQRPFRYYLNNISILWLINSASPNITFDLSGLFMYYIEIVIK